MAGFFYAIAKNRFAPLPEMYVRQDFYAFKLQDHASFLFA
jgi:hypothetical protein